MPKSILIVEDEEDLVTMMKFQFTVKGYEVRTAGNGLEALDILGGARPDLVILDLNMPKMGGIEFCQRIMDAKGKFKQKMLILTARANIQHVLQEKKIKVDSVMIKPFDILQLTEVVDKLLSC